MSFNAISVQSTRYSPNCNSQVPGYLEQYEAFKAKGVKDIYVVAVNDIFVMNAWKHQMIGEHKPDSIKFGGLGLDPPFPDWAALITVFSSCLFEHSPFECFCIAIGRSCFC